MGLPTWVDDEQYQIQCKAYDNAGNPEADLYPSLDDGATWRCDKTPAVSTITVPTMPEQPYTGLPTISGKAYDKYGVSKVYARIFDISNGATWDDSANGGTGGWNTDGDIPIWNVADGSSTTGGWFGWTYDSPSGANGWPICRRTSFGPTVW